MPRIPVLSRLFCPTSKESLLKGQEGTVASHELMLRSGLIRQSSSGVYNYLPFALRVLEKVERIVDREMQAIGGQKLSMPNLLSADAWKQSGRWESSGRELFRLKDRKGTDFLLSPTHEEEITTLVASEVSSYRQLPLRLYQIGRKFRDEMRPRSGLLRGREFLMKDLYSFDCTEEEAVQTYREVQQAYERIFEAIGIPYAVADADTGNIGGTMSHEYHIKSAVGEDTLLSCPTCNYSANEERAVGQLSTTQSPVTVNVKELLSLVQDPNATITTHFAFMAHTDESVTNSDAIHPSTQLNLVALFIDRAREVNLLKAQDFLSKTASTANSMQLEAASIDQVTEAVKGVSKVSVTTLVDESVSSSAMNNTSASLDTQVTQNDDHSVLHHLLAGSASYVGDFRNAKAGDTCSQCNAIRQRHVPLVSSRAIEVGHTFLLGTKYSSILKANISPRHPAFPGEQVPIQMGCYGLGLSRILAAIVESSYDDRGIVWPKSVAPYFAAVIPVDDKNKDIAALTEQVVQSIPSSLLSNVVLDDRAARFGAKMTDAELVGYPYLIVCGRKAMTEGMLEVKERVLGGTKKHVVKLEHIGQWLEDRQVQV